MNNRYRALIVFIAVIILWKFVDYLGIRREEQVQKTKSSDSANPLLEKLKVTVYYEALCSDSKNFILKQLQPTYNDLKNYISIEFVPYGKAEVISSKTDLNAKYIICYFVF